MGKVAFQQTQAGQTGGMKKGGTMAPTPSFYGTNATVSMMSTGYATSSAGLLVAGGFGAEGRMRIFAVFRKRPRMVVNPFEVFRALLHPLAIALMSEIL